jgi:hypothetical protein
MSLFSSTAFYNIQPAVAAAGPAYQFRADPYASSLVLAMPMSSFPTLGMTDYKQDVSALIKAAGSNVSLVVTGSNVYASGSTCTFSTASWSAEGYVNSGYGGTTTMYGAPTTTTVNFSTSNFVIEAYINFPAVLINYHTTIFGQNSGDYLLADCSEYSGGQYIRFYIGGSGSPVSAPTWVANTWYHVAYVRSGDNFYSYVNGTRYGNFSRAGAVPASPDGFWRLLGYASDANSSVPKITQDFRLYIGTDKGYTGATITPPLSIVQKV